MYSTDANFILLVVNNYKFIYYNKYLFLKNNLNLINVKAHDHDAYKIPSIIAIINSILNHFEQTILTLSRPKIIKSNLKHTTQGQDLNHSFDVFAQTYRAIAWRASYLSFPQPCLLRRTHAWNKLQFRQQKTASSSRNVMWWSHWSCFRWYLPAYPWQLTRKNVA